MPADRDPYWLRDMLDSAQRAMRCAQGVLETQFYADLFVQDAVAWRITIIGEAARRVTDETRRKIPALPWGQITRMRNRLVHEYSHIRADVMWTTVRDDLPILVAELESYLRSISPPGGTP